MTKPSGDVATRNIQQAPFIIALQRGHKLTEWQIEEGWGNGWGIYFTASTHKAGKQLQNIFQLKLVMKISYQNQFQTQLQLE